jgi:hypothetical protein
MKIEEGSVLNIFNGSSGSDDNILADKIIANEDINIEGDGRGYLFLLRTKGYDSNSTFESDKIEKVGEAEYAIYGYFKDAILVVRDKNCIVMYQSYMNV